MLRSKLYSAAALVLLLAAWGLFAPIPLGGQAAYVIVDGNSMEPGMRRGDLAILRRADTYRVGDVVTYRHPTIGHVIHRIVARDGDRYVFQGDNNTWVDSYRPAAGELVGRLWIHLPGAGRAMELARQPLVMALLTALLIGSALMTAFEPTRTARRRRAARPDAPRPAAQHGAWLGTAFTVCLALGMLSAIAGVFAFGTPATRAAEAGVPFAHTGRIEYSAEAPAGLYDGGAATTGDPIFRRLTDSVAVRFTYALDADRPAIVEGTARLRAELSDGEGWRRTVELAPPVALSDGGAVVSGTLRLDEIQSLIASYEQLGGVVRSQYILTLAPVVELRGAVGGAALEERFAPHAEFRLDAARLQPLATAEEAPFAPRQERSLTAAREEPATVGFWVLRAEVMTARRLALAGLEVALVAMVLLAWRVRRELGAGEDAAIMLRYRPLVVSAQRPGPWTAGAAELTTIDDLARVAERAGHAMVRVDHCGAVSYYVRDGVSVYSYRVRGAEPAAAELEQAT